MAVPAGAKLLATAAQMAVVPEAIEKAGMVAAASAGVAAPAHVLSWAGSVSLPTEVGWVEATLTGNATLSLPARGATAEIINLLVIQDSVGGHTLSIPSALASFGVPVVLSAAPGSIDLLSLVWTGSRWLVLPGALNLKVPA